MKSYARKQKCNLNIEQLHLRVESTAHFSGFGGEIVAEEFYESGATDFAAQLTPIAETAPEAVFLSGLPPEVALETKQARALPLQNAAGEPTI